MRKYLRAFVIIMVLIFVLNLGSVYAADILDVTIRGDYKGDLGKFLSQTIYYINEPLNEVGKYPLVIKDESRFNWDFSANFLFAHAVVNGYAIKDSKGRYYVDKYMRGDEIAYYFYKYVFKEKVKVNTNTQVFADVPKSSPYFKAVSAFKDYLVPISTMNGKKLYLNEPFNFFTLDKFLYFVSKLYNVKIQMNQKEALDFLKKNKVTNCNGKYAVYVAQMLKNSLSLMLILKYVNHSELDYLEPNELDVSDRVDLEYIYAFLASLDIPVLDTEDKLIDYLSRYTVKDYGKLAYYIVPKKFYTSTYKRRFKLIEDFFGDIVYDNLLVTNISGFFSSPDSLVPYFSSDYALTSIFMVPREVYIKYISHDNMDGTLSLTDLYIIKSKIREIIKNVGITPGMSLRDKMEKLAIEEGKYLEYNEEKTPYNHLKALVIGYGVCMDYADLYTMLCTLYGIPTVRVDISLFNHAMNVVAINGIDYYLDAGMFDVEPLCEDNLWFAKKYFLVTKEKLLELDKEQILRSADDEKTKENDIKKLYREDSYVTNYYYYYRVSNREVVLLKEKILKSFRKNGLKFFGE